MMMYKFFTPAFAVVSPWSLRDNKSLQLSWILLSIAADLTIIWSWFFWFPTPPIFFQTLGSVFKWTNYNWYHCQLHVSQFVFLSSLKRFKYLSILFTCFYFLSVVCQNGKIHYYYYYYYIILPSRLGL